MGGISFLLLTIVSTIFQQTSGFVPVTHIKSFQKLSPTKSALYSSLDSDEAVESPIQKLIALGSKITSSKPYSALETVILLGVLSAVDGGFSGDWSRLGLVTTDVETTIKSTITSVGLFHLVCAPIAVLSTTLKKQPVVPALLHTLAIGGLGLGRVLFQEEDTLLQIPDIRQSIANTVAFVFAGTYDEEAVAQSIDDIIDENAIVMFAFSTCPFCIKAKSLLIDELGVQNLKVIDLDIDKKTGLPIKAMLGVKTGRNTVPSIWIGGQLIGGCNDGPTSVTVPAVTGRAAGVNFFGIGDKTEAIIASPAEVIATKGGVFSLNNEGVLEKILTGAKVKYGAGASAVGSSKSASV